MQKFFFTQCACVLFDRAPRLEDLERALDSWAVACPQQPAAGDDGWMACGPGFVVELRSGTGVVVDVIDRPWPDDPRAAADVPALGAAWRAGMFGPSAAPGALARAKEQRWAWQEGAAAADRHRAVVRMRTFVDVPQEGPRELPKGHDPVHELTTLIEMAGAILRLDAATALFLPAGETLRSREQVGRRRRRPESSRRSTGRCCGGSPSRARSRPRRCWRASSGGDLAPGADHLRRARPPASRSACPQARSVPRLTTRSRRRRRSAGPACRRTPSPRARGAPRGSSPGPTAAASRAARPSRRRRRRRRRASPGTA
jgi:hypothetical protein